jgi:hypothetical protein
VRETRALKTLIFNRFSLIRERKRLPILLFKKSGGQDIYPIKKFYQGFVPYESRGNLRKTKEVKVNYSGEQFEAFEEILDQFKRDRINVIFVQVPEYISGRHSADYWKNMENL